MSADYRVHVSWVELHHRGQDEERLVFAKVYPAPGKQAAIELWRQARQDNGWAPRHAVEVQVDLAGPDLNWTRAPSPANLAGVAAAREELAELVRRLAARSVCGKTDRGSRAAATTQAA